MRTELLFALQAQAKSCGRSRGAKQTVERASRGLDRSGWGGNTASMFHCDAVVETVDEEHHKSHLIKSTYGMLHSQITSPNYLMSLV